MSTVPPSAVIRLEVVDAELHAELRTLIARPIAMQIVGMDDDDFFSRTISSRD